MIFSPLHEHAQLTVMYCAESSVTQVLAAGHILSLSSLLKHHLFDNSTAP